MQTCHRSRGWSARKLRHTNPTGVRRKNMALDQLMIGHIMDSYYISSGPILTPLTDLLYPPEREPHPS